MKAVETPFYFSAGRGRLFGFLHEPAGKGVGQGLVVCPPLGEEHLWSQRVFVNLARDLAAQGHPVLRFDYLGTGDSEGDFEQCSVTSMLEDIGSAVDVLRHKVTAVDQVALLGLRFGATLAVLAADAHDTVTSLALWDPILNGASYMQGLLRSNIATQMAMYREIRFDTEALVGSLKAGHTVNVEGYEVSRALYEQAAAIDLLKHPVPHVERALLIQISKKECEISQQYKEMLARWTNCETLVAVEPPFWREIRPYRPRADELFRMTQAWLEKGRQQA